MPWRNLHSWAFISGFFLFVYFPRSSTQDVARSCSLFVGSGNMIHYICKQALCLLLYSFHSQNSGEKKINKNAGSTRVEKLIFWHFSKCRNSGHGKVERVWERKSFVDRSSSYQSPEHPTAIYGWYGENLLSSGGLNQIKIKWLIDLLTAHK